MDIDWRSQTISLLSLDGVGNGCKMTAAMSASQVARHPFKMTRYAATNVKYNPESQKSMHAKKYFKLTPTQEDIYNLLNNTEERPMSSTLSPYAPLPAIGNTFIGPAARGDRKSRREDHKHQVVMETVELKRTKPKNVTRKRQPQVVAKEKSLEMGSTHGRHILNINGLEEKKRARSRDVLLSKAKKLEDVGDKVSSLNIEASERVDNEALTVSDVEEESRTRPSWLSVNGSISNQESFDSGVHMSSDLSALSRSSESLETHNNHESGEFIHNCIKDIEKKGVQSRPNTQLTPKRSRNEKQFTLVRERTYDLLEPKILKGNQEENESDESVSRGRTGITREWSHKVALEQFGPISLEQSTGSIAFGRRLSSSECDDVDDFERPTTSGSATLNADDYVADINDNTGDELNNQIWQLRNSNQSSPMNPRRNNVGTVPRVLELKRSHMGLPSASRFSKETEGDSELWGMRNKMMNRLNSPLRLKSGKVSENTVRILDVTPLHLEDRSATRMLSSHGRINRDQDVKTPYIEEVASLESGVKARSSRDGNRKVRIWDTKTPNIEEIDAGINNMRLGGDVQSARKSRLLDSEEIVNTQSGVDSVRKAVGWDTRKRSSRERFSSGMKSAHRRGGMSMFIDMKTPSIEEIGSVDSDTAGAGQTYGASAASARKPRSWKVTTPNIGNDGDAAGARDSIEEIETTEGQDRADNEETDTKHKAYWIDI